MKAVRKISENKKLEGALDYEKARAGELSS